MNEIVITMEKDGMRWWQHSTAHKPHAIQKQKQKEFKCKLTVKFNLLIFITVLILNEKKKKHQILYRNVCVCL